MFVYVTVCLCPSKDLANRCTDMVVVYSEAYNVSFITISEEGTYTLPKEIT